jgi:hypothetical protein
MAFEYDPVSGLQHYPVPMARFGQNLYGDNLYRIVLASTRLKLVGGCWPDGEFGYHWVPAYRGINGWILERWQMPLKSQWEAVVEPISGWPVNGPYPARGEYYHAWTFDKGVDADNLDTLIGAIERGRNRSVQDLDDFNRTEYQAEDKETRRNAYDEIRDAFTAFGGRAFSSSRVARGIKTRDQLMTAEQAGLPIPRPLVRPPKPTGARRTVDVRDIEVRNTISAGR